MANASDCYRNLRLFDQNVFFCRNSLPMLVICDGQTQGESTMHQIVVIVLCRLRPLFDRGLGPFNSRPSL